MVKLWKELAYTSANNYYYALLQFSCEIQPNGNTNYYLYLL